MVPISERQYGFQQEKSTIPPTLRPRKELRMDFEDLENASTRGLSQTKKRSISLQDIVRGYGFSLYLDQ